MPRPSLRWPLAIAFVLAVGASPWLTSKPGRGAAGAAPADANKDRKEKTRLYYGTFACARCHTTAPPKWPLPLLCKCTEAPFWEKHDKHGDAYAVLLGKRAKQMGELLKTDVTQDERCLQCHSAVIKDKALAEKSKDEGFFKPEEGVSCVICHGANKAWVSPHGDPLEIGTWRPKDPKKRKTRTQKDDEYGMTDLWDPVKRTRLCASCHIGNIEQNKFVTHEMYAAGHPPLPGFEIAFFSDQMPRHWDYLREKKSEEVRKELGYNGTERERATLVLVGAAESLAVYMRLLESQAANCRKSTDPDKQVLDFANFDCASCHHDLRSPSWRQTRGFAGKPGRVPILNWPTALLDLALTHAAANDREAEQMQAVFVGKLKAVHEAIDSKPFGNPAQVERAARALAEDADALAQKLKDKPCDPAAVTRLLRQLPVLYKGASLDYDSARQVAFALKMLHADYVQTTPEIKSVLSKLDEQFQLSFPAKLAPLKDKEGKIVKSVLELITEGKLEGPIITQLKGNLLRAGNYDPNLFQKTLQELLPPATPR